MSQLTSREPAGAAAPTLTVHRIEVWPTPAAGDPRGESVRRQATDLGAPCRLVRTARVYLIQAALDQAQLDTLRTKLLADPVLERSLVGSAPVSDDAQLVEVHPLPGVMDPVAQTVQRAAADLTGVTDVHVMTGTRYDFQGITSDQADTLARQLLANPVVESIHRSPYCPDAFPVAAPADLTLRHVSITTLSDDELERLSRSAHLFLSLEEMHTIQSHFRAAGREPTDVEIETLAQTWSEHCVHKTLKSTVHYTPPAGDIIDWSGRPGVDVQPDGSVIIHNLLKSTIVAATNELIADGLDWTLSVFVDNAGIIAFDENHAVCVKVETHNHPSALEPYGGAATGVGGCIRDIIATGRAAKPIANTDVFCVAMPDMSPDDVPDGCLHPRRILTRVVDGVRDYGNRMGIPTLNGAVHFDNRYVGNPLVFCGCVGVMPRDKIVGDPNPGDHIIALGGRTGRDGIHGATFSSAELTDAHADEFSHAVQIGNAIEEKRTLDAILRARDHARGCLFSAINDCGAGGFSSAIGEMGEALGAQVHLHRAPLKYQGLRYDEIWISESQERMILAVPEKNIAALQQICNEESVEMADLGTFATPDRELILNYAGTEVGRLSMAFLHEGIPMPTRHATSPSPPAPPTSSSGAGVPPATPPPTPPSGTGVPPVTPPPTPPSGAGVPPVTTHSPSLIDLNIKSTLLDLLRHPNIASKKWIVRQYDHEVQGATIIKPLVGPAGIGPGDAAVIQPVPGSKQGLAIACGMATPIGDPATGGDPYLMALAAVDECVRNLVCVGADPTRIAILDNFCWPSCDRPENMGALVRASVGCYDAAKAYAAPFISGKDSLNNQFRTKDGSLIEIPPTLLITGVGIVPDVNKCVTMDLKPIDQTIIVAVRPLDGRHPHLTEQSAHVARAVAGFVQQRSVYAAHDSSEGGILVALAEMMIASTVGVHLHDDFLATDTPSQLSIARAFDDLPATFLIQVDSDKYSAVIEPLLRASDLAACRVATVDTNSAELTIDAQRIPISDLTHAFHSTLDW